jgi:DNA-binding beta-propeller fold protein YncE
MQPATTSLFVAVIFAAGTSPLSAAPPLTAGTPVVLQGTKGGFDFLEIDAAMGRLLADHTGNGTLDVIDTATGKLIKSVPTGAAQGVAVDEAGGRYCVSVSKEQRMVIVDRQKLEVTGEVKLGGPADAIAFNSKNGFAYVGHDDAKELWVVDPNGKRIVTTIAIGEGPEYVIADAATGRVYQNIKSNDTLAVIDSATNKVIDSWTTKPATKPHGLALEAKTHRLFVAGVNGSLVIMDTTSGKVTGDVKIAPGIDQMAFDPGLRRLYCASGTGVMTVVQVTDTGAVSLGDVKTAKGAKTVAVEEKTHTVWTAYVDASGPCILKLSAAK